MQSKGKKRKNEERINVSPTRHKKKKKLVADFKYTLVASKLELVFVVTF